MRIRHTLYSFCLLGIICSSCAQFDTPKGGPKDTTPPVLLKAESEENYQTQFKKKPIELTFNEWISLSNPIKEVVVSPPTNYPPKIILKKRTVVFEFSEEEELKDSTTYQINFGKAIRDFTEGNVYENFIFVFSTGDVIDSLELSGTVKDAVTGKPADDYLVVLYDNLSDTAFFTQKPLYFSRTNKDGTFKLQNIRADSFQLFTLKDENVSYFYDLPNEIVGYYDDLIVLQDSSIQNIELLAFDEEDPLQLIEAKQNINGRIDVSYQKPPFNFSYQIIDDSIPYSFKETVKDSIYIWHNALELDSFYISLTADETIDTSLIKKRKKSLSDQKLKLNTISRNLIQFFRDDFFKLEFNKPIASISLDSFNLSDTTQSFEINSFEIEGREISFKADSLKETQELTLTAVPGAIVDIYGVSNLDSIKLSLKTYENAVFGNINLDVLNESDTSYILQLNFRDKLINEFNIDSTQRLSFDRMEKGKYSLYIIEDLNQDGRWTTGSIKEKRAPEKTKTVPLEELKAGWDLETEIDLKSIFDGTEIN